MKRRMLTLYVLLSMILILGMGFTGCAGAPETAAASEEKAASAEAEPEWTIRLLGTHEDEITSTYFEEAKQHGSHYVEMELERKGETNVYKGMPFRMIAAMTDGADRNHPYKFDRQLWESGYDITITASDGYSVTFNTAEVSYEDIILADSMDGMEIPPQIVGNVTGKLWVKDVTDIELGLGTETGAEEEFALRIDINDTEAAFSLEELEASPFYVEGRGSFTTSAGTTYTNTYGGIVFADFLNSFMNLQRDNTVTLVAMDGYEMTYSGEQILDDSDGEWILAFKMDGEYMEVDPGYIRTVKIGPSVPNIEGHLSVKMIEKIVASGEAYKDFTLMMKGRMNVEVDRQTMQSGISCHKKTVTYFDRKAEEDIEYTGIPLHYLLAFSDDPRYAPHQQDSSIISYDAEAAEAGYKVKITAADGFSITLDSRELHRNNDVIIAMYRNGEPLPDREFPLIIVWDKDAETVPAGIKAVRNITEIELIF
ncbi:MAG: molybdopterin-dependent oxidoreductase [Spirochaetia bacterium]